MVGRSAFSCLLVVALVRTVVAAEPAAPAEPSETESSATNLDVSLGVLSSMSVRAATAAVAQGTVLPWQFDVEGALWIPVGGKVSNVDVSANDFDSGAGTMGWVRFDGVNRNEGLGVFAEFTTLNYEVATSTPALTAISSSLGSAPGPRSPL